MYYFLELDTVVSIVDGYVAYNFFFLISEWMTVTIMLLWYHSSITCVTGSNYYCSSFHVELDSYLSQMYSVAYKMTSAKRCITWGAAVYYLFKNAATLLRS